MTEEHRTELIRALLFERSGYVQRGLTDKVAGVDAELHRLGHEAAAPAKRAATRTKKPAEKR